MEIQAYLKDINNKSQEIFTLSLQQSEKIGRAHHFSACIHEFTENINDIHEKQLFTKVCTQLEAATFNTTLGLYRQGFATLRLAFEMSLATVYFSAHKIELHEWLTGNNDIKWNVLIDPDNGVLSKRFTKAFFPEFSNDISHYLVVAKSTYRNLSEYVHGNNATWKKSGLNIEFNQVMFDKYFEFFQNVFEVITILLTTRYINTFKQNTIDSLVFIPEHFQHINSLRQKFGGPKEQ